MTAPDGERLYSVPEAARLKGVSRTAIWYAIEDGRLRAERVGRNWVIRARDLRAYTPRRRPREEER
jgi:excisionase family DNA binding protein